MIAYTLITSRPRVKKSLQAMVGGFVLVSALAVPLVALGPLAPASVAAQEVGAEHLRLGARFAELTGANQLYVSALNAQRRDIIRAIASTNPDIAPTVTEVADLAYLDMAETTGPLFEEIASIYATAYSQEDLTEMVGFFESDVGQRYLGTRRDIEQGILEATIGWGDQISVDFLARVRALLSERGIEL